MSVPIPLSKLYCFKAMKVLNRLKSKKYFLLGKTGKKLKLKIFRYRSQCLFMSLFYITHK